MTTEPRFEHAGVRYGVRCWGDRSANSGSSAYGAPLVLVHGFAQSVASWDEVAGRLARDRAVYALDLVGAATAPIVRKPTRSMRRPKPCSHSSAPSRMARAAEKAASLP